MCDKYFDKAIEKATVRVMNELKENIKVSVNSIKPLSEYSTRELVEELSKRVGVKTFETNVEGYHEIKATVLENEFETTTIRKINGPSIILEIID